MTFIDGQRSFWRTFITWSNAEKDKSRNKLKNEFFCRVETHKHTHKHTHKCTHMHAQTSCDVQENIEEIKLWMSNIERKVTMTKGTQAKKKSNTENEQYKWCWEGSNSRNRNNGVCVSSSGRGDDYFGIQSNNGTLIMKKMALKHGVKRRQVWIFCVQCHLCKHACKVVV